ncbi:MAG TPA: hypothetical protein VFC85_09500 [Verrucomicrobiae bacterium]|nr:hypothetical protein [Verrucomicrobiae bacterium]
MAALAMPPSKDFFARVLVFEGGSGDSPASAISGAGLAARVEVFFLAGTDVGLIFMDLNFLISLTTIVVSLK